MKKGIEWTVKYEEATGKVFIEIWDDGENVDIKEMDGTYTPEEFNSTIIGEIQRLSGTTGAAVTIALPLCKCLRPGCGKEWVSRTVERPKTCPACRSVLWYKIPH